MQPDEIKAILSAIADVGDIPFEPGDGQTLCLALSDGSEVMLELDSEGDSLLLSASLFSVPEQDLGVELRRAMELNHLNEGTSGATLGFNPHDGFIVMSALIPSRLLDEASFMAALNAFCKQTMTFRTGLPDPNRGGVGEPPSEASAEHRADGPKTFLRG